jgi:thiamine biosynthesis protein ThiI
MVAVGAASAMPVFRPLAGDDKQEIISLARRIGTFDISAEPFHDCCRILLPRSPELYASAAELERAEAGLDVPGLVRTTLGTARLERYTLSAGRVERVESPEPAAVPSEKHTAAGQF